LRDLSASKQEIATKLERVRALLEDPAADVESVVLTRQASVSWLLAGFEHMVVRGADPAFAWAVVTEDSATIIALNNEGARLREEGRIEELGVELVLGSWWETNLGQLVGTVADPRTMAHDGFGPGVDWGDRLQELRLQLVPAEAQRFEAVGFDTAGAVEQALQGLGASELMTMRERDLAARLVAALEERGILAGGLMVGGERRRRYRHPVTTDEVIGSSVLVVVVGTRGGLHVALSRSACAEPPDDETRLRHRLACEVESALVTGCRVGRSWTAALGDGLHVLANAGYADEWKQHTQGGPIGYGPREFVVTPDAEEGSRAALSIQGAEAVAWNPTIQGAKSEDTFLINDGVPRSISNPPESAWPMVTVEGPDGAVPRPEILKLS
jgi:Xaa-Pro dipeptidase